MSTPKRAAKNAQSRESQVALSQLKEMSEHLAAEGSLPPGVFPGAPVAIPGRLHGRYAAVTLSMPGAQAVTLLCFDWEVTMTQEFADGTAHGDFWDVPIPLKMSWTGRVRGYFPSSTAPIAANSYSFAGFRGPGDPATGTITAFSTVATSGGSEKILFTGVCYASRVGLSAPIGGMFTQEMELRGVGAPTVGVLLT